LQYRETMLRTNGGRDDRRVGRWLGTQRGFVGQPSAAAWDLLSQRLRVRRNAGVASIPLFVLVGVAFGASVASYGSLSDNAWWHIGLILPGVVFLAAALMLWQELAYRVDHRIAAGLAQRVSTAAPRGMLPILGRRGTALVAAEVVTQGAIALALLVSDSGWLGWAYLACYLATCAYTWISLRRIRSQPVVAVDPSSLILDHRLKTADAIQAAIPLCTLSGFFIPAIMNDTTAHHFYLAALLWASFWLSGFALGWARSENWPRSTTPFTRWNPNAPPARPAGPPA
jgi:hypothetical protein